MSAISASTKTDFKVVNPRKSANEQRKFVGTTLERSKSKAARAHSLNQRKDWIATKQKPIPVARESSSSSISEGSSDEPRALAGQRTTAKAALAALHHLVRMDTGQMEKAEGSAELVAYLKTLPKSQFDLKQTKHAKAESRFLKTPAPLKLISLLAECGLSDVAGDLVSRCPKGVVISYATDLLKEQLPEAMDDALAQCTGRAERELARTKRYVLEGQANPLKRQLEIAKNDRAKIGNSEPPVRFEGIDIHQGDIIVNVAASDSFASSLFNFGRTATKESVEKHIVSEHAKAPHDMDMLAGLYLGAMLHGLENLELLAPAAPLAFQKMMALLGEYSRGEPRAIEALSRLAHHDGTMLTGKESFDVLDKMMAIALKLAGRENLRTSVGAIVPKLDQRPDLRNAMLRALSVGKEFEVLVETAYQRKDLEFDDPEAAVFADNLCRNFGEKFPMPKKLLDKLQAGLDATPADQRKDAGRAVSRFIEGRLEHFAERAMTEPSNWLAFKDLLKQAKPLLLADEYAKFKKMPPK